MVWTSTWSCSSLRKQMAFMVAWSTPVDRFGVLLGFNLFKDFSCGFDKGLKEKTSFFPEKKKLHMWLFPIWFITHLLNKSWFNKPPPPWSPTLGYPTNFTSPNPVRWHIPGSYFRSTGWCHPWCILRSWRVRVGSRHQGQRLWYQPYVP